MPMLKILHSIASDVPHSAFFYLRKAVPAACLLLKFAMPESNRISEYELMYLHTYHRKIMHTVKLGHIY